MNRHNEKESQSTGSSLIGIVFCVWFFGSMAAALVAGYAGQAGWVAFCIGQFFFVIGIMVVYKQIKHDALEPIFFVFSIVGFFMMVCGFLWQTGADAMRDSVVNMVPFLLLGLFLVVGILIVISALIGKNRQSQCTVAVLGKCVEVKWTYRSSGDPTVPRSPVTIRSKSAGPVPVSSKWARMVSKAAGEVVKDRR